MSVSTVWPSVYLRRIYTDFAQDIRCYHLISDGEIDYFVAPPWFGYKFVSNARDQIMW